MAKFCIDCRWWRGVTERDKPDVIMDHLCMNPSVNGPVHDLVTGEELHRGMHHCAVQRRPHLGMCGPLGTLWEAKP